MTIKTLMRITFVTALQLQAILRISMVRDHVNLFVNVNQIIKYLQISV